MQTKTINEISEMYDLDLDKIVSTIKKQKAKNVLLQFPEGLKPYSTVISKYLESKTKNVEFMIWLDSCFGACDVPVETERLGVDLIVQFGHNSFVKTW